VAHVPHLRISEVAELLGVSDDTVRRWVEQGRLPAVPSSGGPRLVEGSDVARLAEETGRAPQVGAVAGASARNRFRGVVTRVTRDTVMAQVEVQAGPFRVVSLLSREAVDELALEPGSVVVATTKATSVGLEVPAR
jgi:molybdopterin-binding protein